MLMAQTKAAPSSVSNEAQTSQASKKTGKTQNTRPPYTQNQAAPPRTSNGQTLRAFLSSTAPSPKMSTACTIQLGHPGCMIAPSTPPPNSLTPMERHGRSTANTSGECISKAKPSLWTSGYKNPTPLSKTTKRSHSTPPIQKIERCTKRFKSA